MGAAAAAAAAESGLLDTAAAYVLDIFILLEDFCGTRPETNPPGLSNVPLVSMTCSNEAVAAWFHARGADGWSPALTLRDVLDVCLGALKAQRLTLCYGENEIRRLFCQALCVLYQGQGRALAFRKPPPTPAPEDWTEDHETLWGFFLGAELPDWLSLLRDVGVCVWESDLPGWRDTLTSLFQYYLVREERVLIESGLLWEEEEDEQTA